MNVSISETDLYSAERTLSTQNGEDRCNEQSRNRRIICIDNLGKNYDCEQIKSQLLVLFPNTLNVRFGSVTHKNEEFQWGWCFIEFKTHNEAVKCLSIMDHVYLRVGTETILRPLLAHFPIWNERLSDVDVAASYESHALSLHLGQPSNMDRLSWEFVILEQALDKIKQTIIEDIIEQLKPFLKRPKNLKMMQDNMVKCDHCTVWLKNVPLDTSNDELVPFFKCFDNEVIVRRLEDSFTNSASNNVFVTFSNTVKAKHVLQDIESLMLLSRGIRPISGSLLDSYQGRSFESVFDLTLSSVGLQLESCLFSHQLVIVDEAKTEEEKNAICIRSILKVMQRQRFLFRKFKHQKRLQLAQNLSDQLAAIHEKYKTIDELLNKADTLFA